MVREMKQTFLVARPLSQRRGPEAPMQVYAGTDIDALVKATNTLKGDWVMTLHFPGDTECWAVWPQRGGHAQFFTQLDT